MPLSRLENFLINTDGNILYVNPSDLDSTDSFDNKGNSLTRPFKTIQRALLEAARFAYQTGPSNDKFDKTTILLYPGTHIVDNRPGYYLRSNGGSAQYLDVNESVVGSPNIELSNSSVFDLNNSSNVLYKFNSVHGGVIVPKGTSIVGLDLRKTKVRPLYVPDPADSTIERSSIFKITGGCYFWQFSLFDGDRPVFYSKDFSQKADPSFSHHKLTCFEYADGVNKEDLTSLTDLQMYYFKLMNAYGDDTGTREIVDYPTSTDFEPNSPEFKIVGDLVSDDNPINEISSDGLVATVLTQNDHNFTVDDSIRIIGISSETYNGRFKVVGITSDRKFTYNLLSDPVDNIVTPTADSKVAVEVDNVNGASPYIFNISMRSAFGMCGMHADGDKATGFKSMVVAQFTGIGLQNDDEAFIIYNDTTATYDTNSSTALSNRPLHLNQEAIYKPDYNNFHVKTSNNAVIQAVSVFAIGFAEHFVSVNGADQSITNSNSNFGAKSLVSEGFRKQSFDRDDTGYITHIVPPKDLQESEFNVLWKTIDVGITTTAGGANGITSTSGARLYLLDEKDLDNPPTNITNGFRVGSKNEEVLFLDVNLDGVNTEFSSKVVMQVPNNELPVATQKEYLVDSVGISTNSIVLREDHKLFTGESIRIYSDDGSLPDGIEYGRLYYAIVTGTDTIQISKSYNNSVSGLADAEINIKNDVGGNLRICSRVTDKIPGEAGHPIQYDSTQQNWYIMSDATFTESSATIYTGIHNNSFAIGRNNSSTYVKRKSESRDLNDRIYRFRYVIPKEFQNAKAPEKNFIIQESKTVGEDATIENVKSNRNPRVISGITTSGSVATVTTEIEHGLSVNDRIRIKNVISSTNTSGVGNTGFNGYFTVTDVPSVLSFKFTNNKNGGSYEDITYDCRNNQNNRTITDLPVFERNEYDTTYIIENVETVQEYISDQQDGIYYLTLLIGNVSPTDPYFSSYKFKQSPYYLYPTVDKDNLVVDPVQSISAASNKLIGKTLINDSLNSITKESALNYIKDNRVGFAITDATSDATGIATVFLSQNHNLNRVLKITGVDASGSNYAGVSTTLYNVATTVDGSSEGEGATVNIVVNASGQITSAELVNGGCSYLDADKLAVVGGDGLGRLNIEVASDDASAERKSIEVIGIGTTGNTTNSAYNGLYRVLDASKPREIEYGYVGNNRANTSTLNYGTEVGTFVSSSNPMCFVSGNLVTIDTLVGHDANQPGIATCTTVGSHDFSVGNKIKLSNITGTARTVYSDKSFIVQEVIAHNKFTIKTNLGVGITNPSGTAFAMKHGIGAFGEDTSLSAEKIGGRLISLIQGSVHSRLSSALAEDSTTVVLNSTQGIRKGDFIQIRNEIMRVKTVDNSTQLTVIRSVLGSRSSSHLSNTEIKVIKTVPSEVRRFSSIRASGHTFEYIGYGPGNYSTALPQKQVRVIDEEEEFLAISKEQKGGVTFFSGMNDRGEFFTWDGRIKSRETFLGEVGSDATSTFDDIYIRNSLRVGGGSNRNLPSEFRGPVNFTSKITSTSIEGLDAIKMMLKGTAFENPSFQVGPDANPSLIVNKDSQLVGIKTATPSHELDVNGTIRAEAYENFKLTDLPNSRTKESTFNRNRILKVNNAGNGYELVDIHEIDSFALRSYGISNDGTVYSGIGTVISTSDAIASAGSATTFTSAELTTKLGSDGAIKITGINTSRFFVGQKAKVFGTTLVDDTTLIPDPSWAGMKADKAGTSPTVDKVYYWVAQYNYRNGKVGISSQINPVSGIGLTTIQNFNDIDHVTLTLSRTDTQHGLLVYRQIRVGATGNPDINNAKLIGILGPKELEDNTSNIIWKDYGTYDQPEWSPNGTVNEFDADQIHFPNIATTGHRRGWGIGEIISIEANSIILDKSFIQFNSDGGNPGFGTTSAVNVTHDNTFALGQAIEDTVASGGNYLDLPSGTYLTNKLVLPTRFTLRGNGKNTVIKQQFFANDSDDGQGNSIDFEGNLVGIGTTNPKDITIQDLTIDGNNGNNIRFETSIDSYLVYLPNISSSTMKNFEIRNSPADGLYVYNSTRLAMEGCAIVDGSATDRYTYVPVNAQESDVLRVNDCLFENYPGSVDISATNVVSTGGNIIRNCGSGLKVFASGKITTTNNIILGPSDEYIPSPDIYDSDYNSINITIDRSTDFYSPVFQYLRNGEPYDISSTQVSINEIGIGTMVGLYNTTVADTLGSKFLDFEVVTQDAGEFGRQNGYFQFKLIQSDAATLGISSALGYDIIAQEYLKQPIGFTTTVGISSGVWNTIGAGATSYTVTLSTPGHLVGFATGDIVKLVQHNATPSVTTFEFIVDEKISVDAATKNMRLKLVSPTSVTSQVGGLETGYITIRDRFTIAKGRVGVI